MKGAGDKVCCTFITYNVLATLFGLLVVAVASWLAADKISFFTELKLVEPSVSEEFANVSVVDYGAFILVAIGVAIVIQSVLGCTGTMMGCCGNRKARTFLRVYGVLVALVVIVEIVAAILVLYVFKEKISVEAKSFMKKTIDDDYRIEGQDFSRLHKTCPVKRYFANQEIIISNCYRRGEQRDRPVEQDHDRPQLLRS